jgi:hypothetical protein
VGRGSGVRHRHGTLKARQVLAPIRTRIRGAAVAACAVLLAIAAWFLLRGQVWQAGPFTVGFFSLLAVLFYSSRLLRNFTFTVSVGD